MSATVIMRRFYLAMCMNDNCPSLVRLLEGRKTESMRQISDLLTTRNCDNATTCSFFVSKRWCGQGFRNLPHTSVLRLQKCGEKPRFADQTTVLRLRDLRFCCRKLGCARRFSVFPRTSACRAFPEQFAMLRSNVPGRNSVKNTAILLLSTVSGSSDGAQLPLHERH